MLKKVGIIVAAAATGVLAVSSLAFADESNGNLKNDCSFPNRSGDAAQVLDGGNSLLGGIIGSVLGTATNAATQANTLNCTNLNVDDVIDSDSHNRDKTVTETSIEDSGNTED